MSIDQTPGMGVSEKVVDTFLLDGRQLDRKMASAPSEMDSVRFAGPASENATNVNQSTPNPVPGATEISESKQSQLQVSDDRGAKSESTTTTPSSQAPTRCVMGANWMKQANEMMLLRMTIKQVVDRRGSQSIPVGYHSFKIQARFTEEDRKRLQEEIWSCRRYMVQNRMVGRPIEEPRHIKAKLKRFRRSKFETPTTRRSAPDESFIKSNYWSYTRVTLRQPLLLHAHDHLDTLALRMFNSLLTYAFWDSSERPEADRTLVVQLLIHKCLENDDLCNEFYMQLVKQTTDNTDSGSTYIRYWQLFSAVSNIVAPSSEIIRNYIRGHLRKSTMDASSEDSRYATYCQKCMSRTMEKPVRKCPPSAKEISALFSRKLCQETIHLLNGKTCTVEFHSHNTVDEVLRITMNKIGFKIGAQGWALIESLGANERCINRSDFFCDCLFRWEQYVRKNNLSTHVKVTLKKRLFIGSFCNVADDTEVSLLADQCVLDVFEGRLPLDLPTATQLCALRAASEDGDVEAVLRILPRHWRDRIQVDAVAKVASSILSEPARLLHLQFLDTCRQWKFFGASIFEVAQKFSNSFPETVYLALNQEGVSFLKARQASTSLSSYSYHEIVTFSTEARYILYISIKTSTEKLTVCTKSAHHVAFLIRDYMTELKLLPEISSPTDSNQRLQTKGCTFIKRSQSEESALSLTAHHRVPNGPQSTSTTADVSGDIDSTGTSSRDNEPIGMSLESNGHRSRRSVQPIPMSPTPSSSSTSPHTSSAAGPVLAHRSRSLPPSRTKETGKDIIKMSSAGSHIPSSESPTSSLADTATSDSADGVSFTHPIPQISLNPVPPPTAVASVTGPSTSPESPPTIPVYAQINCACTFQESVDDEDEETDDSIVGVLQSGVSQRRPGSKKNLGRGTSLPVPTENVGSGATAPLASTSSSVPDGAIESGRTFRNETGRLETIL